MGLLSPAFLTAVTLLTIVVASHVDDFTSNSATSFSQFQATLNSIYAHNANDTTSNDPRNNTEDNLVLPLSRHAFAKTASAPASTPYKQTGDKNRSKAEARSSGGVTASTSSFGSLVIVKNKDGKRCVTVKRPCGTTCSPDPKSYGMCSGGWKPKYCFKGKKLPVPCPGKKVKMCKSVEKVKDVCQKKVKKKVKCPDTVGKRKVCTYPKVAVHSCKKLPSRCSKLRKKKCRYQTIKKKVPCHKPKRSCRECRNKTAIKKCKVKVTRRVEVPCGGSPTSKPKPSTASTTPRSKASNSPRPKSSNARRTKSPNARRSRPSATPRSKSSKARRSKPSPKPSNARRSKSRNARRSRPSATPRSRPSTTPRSKPSNARRSRPSSTPRSKPSTSPSSTPSTTPRSRPSAAPRSRPSISPSSTPSTTPSYSPSNSPSYSPSASPSYSPSTNLSSTPSTTPDAYQSPIGSDTQSGSNSTSESPLPSPSSTPSVSPAGETEFPDDQDRDDPSFDDESAYDPSFDENFDDFDNFDSFGNELGHEEEEEEEDTDFEESSAIPDSTGSRHEHTKSVQCFASLFNEEDCRDAPLFCQLFDPAFDSDRCTREVCRECKVIKNMRVSRELRSYCRDLRASCHFFSRRLVTRMTETATTVRSGIERDEKTKKCYRKETKTVVVPCNYRLPKSEVCVRGCRVGKCERTKKKRVSKYCRGNLPKDCYKKCSRKFVKRKVCHTVSEKKRGKKECEKVTKVEYKCYKKKTVKKPCKGAAKGPFEKLCSKLQKIKYVCGKVRTKFGKCTGAKGEKKCKTKTCVQKRCS